LLAKHSPPAAELTTPLADSGAYATTSDSTIVYNMWVSISTLTSMGLTDSDADAVTDEVVVPSPTPPTPRPLLRSSGTHDHPDGPMLGFIAPEHNNADPDPITGTSLNHAHASPDRGLDFDLTSLSGISSGGEGWADWNATGVLGGPSVSTDAAVGKYAGDGTIDPSILGGAGLSPAKVDDYLSPPIGRRVELSRAVDEDYRMNDEEEDVMGLLLRRTPATTTLWEWARVKARAERSLWTALSTCRGASELLPVRGFRGRGDADHFRTKLRPIIESNKTTIATTTKAS
ncbi:hypothetical protein V8E53_005750, partial [Lactarius tabidus]